MSSPSDDAIAQTRWLYRRGELLCGPVATPQLLERLYSGEVDSKTEVSPLGSDAFKRLGELDVFRLHIAKAEAQLRVLAHDHAERSTKAKRRKVFLGLLGAVAVMVSIAAMSIARYFAVHGTLQSDEALADTEISVEAPIIGLAQARSGEELVDYPVSGSSRGSTRRAAFRSGGGDSRSGPSGGPPPLEPDGMQVAQFDQSNINGVVASKQGTLRTCFIEEARRQPGFSARIPLEFVIGNDGKVTQLWVDNPTYKTGPLADCLLRELQKWPFRPYSGTRATVGLSFRIGKGA